MGLRLNSRAERQLAQSFAVLGLQPDATAQDVEAAYLTRRTTLQNQSSAEQKLRQLEKAVRFIKVSHRFADRKRTSVPESVSDADRLDRSLRLLGLERGATAQEIDAAITTIRNTVTDRERLREFQKAAYVVKTRGRTKRRKRSQRRVTRFLIITSVMLVGLTIVSGFQLASRFRHHFVRFEPGDTLYRLDDQTRFGIVLEFEPNHAFPNGAQRKAYNVRLYADDKDAWISAQAARSGLTTTP